MKDTKQLFIIGGLAAILYFGIGITSSYALSFNIAIDTAPLIGHPAGPFSLEFQLTDGSGLDDANNTAALNSFNFGSGSAAGSPTLFGGASGDLGTSVTLTDSSFFNEFIQPFTPGNTLSFALSLTTNVDVGPTPDLFSFAILDSTGTEIPTLAGFADVFALVNIDSPTPFLQTFASDTTRAAVGGGDPITIGQPQVEGVVIPEPSTLLLLGSGTISLIFLRRGYDNASRRVFASRKSPVVNPSVNQS